MFVIDDVPPWSPRLRSRSRLSSADKRHFVDPSLAAVALGATAERLRGDLNTAGFLFETLVARDVRVYAGASDCRVSHYRERAGELEADLIAEAADGRWLGFEVKMGQPAVDRAAATLLRLRDTRVESPCAGLAVITMNGVAHQRSDGVWVVPIDQLGP